MVKILKKIDWPALLITLLVIGILAFVGGR